MFSSPVDLISWYPNTVMDRKAWPAAVHGVAKNCTWLSDSWTELNTLTSTHILLGAGLWDDQKMFSVPSCSPSDRGPCGLFSALNTGGKGRKIRRRKKLLLHECSHNFTHIKAVSRLCPHSSVSLGYLWEGKVTDLHWATSGPYFNLIALVSWYINSGHSACNC